MREIKKSLGNFSTIEELKQFLRDDNERPYREKGYRRKLGLNKIRNATIGNYGQKVWVYSRGYGLEFVFTKEEVVKLF